MASRAVGSVTPRTRAARAAGEVGVREQLVHQPQGVGPPAQALPVGFAQVHQTARLTDG
jgi:hypothetical protein